MIQDFAVRYGAPMANRIIKARAGSNLDIATYMSAMSEGIEYYGANGITAFDRNSAFAKLTPDQRVFAYEEGKKYAKTTFAILENAAKKSETAYNRKMGRVFFEAGVKARSELEKQSVNLARVVSVATGINIRFFDSTKDVRKSYFNGRYDGATGTIWLDIKAGDAHNGLVSFAMAHELTHFIKQWSPSKYAVLSQLVISELEASGADVNELVEKQMAKNKKLTPNEALEEVVCDALESTLLDSDKAASTLEKLCKKDKSLAQKIVSHLADIIKRLRQLLIGIAPDSTEGKILRGMKDSYEKLETAFSEALEEAATNHKAAMRKNTAKAAENTEVGVKYSKRTDSSPEVVSIKQQLENAKDELSEMSPVSQKNIYEDLARLDFKQKIAWVNKTIYERGNVIERQNFGKIEVDKKDISSAATYLKTDGEYAAFAALYDVLKRGKLIYKESNHKGRGYDTVTFAAPVKINDVVGNMAVVVRRTKGAHYDMHRIVMPDGSAFEFSAKKETAAGPTGGVPQSGSFYQSTETVSNDSISNPAENVNTEAQISQGNGEKFSLRNVASEEKFEQYNKPITVDDIVSLREIIKAHSGERVSVNKFTSEDTKKAQKWAYKFYNELGTKSPFFRAWFGEWRKTDPTSVKIASIPEYIASNEARKQNRGMVYNSDTGWNIRVSREGETNTISHSGVGRLSEYGLAGIRELVENSVLLDSEVHEHHSNEPKNDLIAFDHKLYAFGKSKNGIALYKITIEEYYHDHKHTNERTFHNLKYIEKVADVGGRTADQSLHGVSTNDNHATNYSISDLYSLVNKYDKDFSSGKTVDSVLLNQDGTPKILYHQTEGDISVFDVGRQGAGTRDNETPFGIFLKSSDKDIGLKGKKQMPLYARVVKPLSVENRTELVQKLRSLSPEYDELWQKSKEIDKEYAEKQKQAVKEFRDYRIKKSQSINKDTGGVELYDDPELVRLLEAKKEVADEWTSKAAQNDLLMKKEIVKTLRAHGYDGVFLKKDEGSFGRTTDAVIVLDNTQIKSATDNIGTFDGEEADIHFSRRSPYAKTDREALISALERSEKVSDSDKAKLKDYKDKLDMLDGFERYLDEIGEEMKALAATDGRQGARGAFGRFLMDFHFVTDVLNY